jgi:hypothetical protein
MPCYVEHWKDLGRVIICGDLGPHCAADPCGASTDFLCDYPVGDGKTCDLPLCARHAHEVAPNIHYCPGHLVLWNAFRDSGGVERELENVVPFKAEGRST